MSPVDPTQLDRALADIRKQYGDSVRLANNFPDPPRISTGSLELDLLTKGGIPIGRISHFYGGKFSAKTLLTMKAIANAQKEDQVCVYYDAEKQFRAPWAIKNGVDVDKLLVVEENKI